MSQITDDRRAEIADALDDMAENLGLAMGFIYVLKNAAKALRTLPVGAETGEVVAWQWTYSIEAGGRILGPFFGTAPPDLSEYPNQRVTPLFAVPNTVGEDKL